MQNNQQAIKNLQTQSILYGFISFTAYYFIFAILNKYWDHADAQRWFLQTGIIYSYQLVSVWKALPKNHLYNQTEIITKLGTANWITLFRLSIIAAIGGLLFLPKLPGIWGWVPGILYLVAILSDMVDGYVARITNHLAPFGEALDMNSDALGVLIITGLSFQYGAVPWWYLLFGFARYFFEFGTWWRKRHNRPVYELTPSMGRRALAGVQMGFINAMLIPVLNPSVTKIAATLFLIPFTIRFYADWLQVSGRISQDFEIAFSNKGNESRFIYTWMPFIFRVFVVLLLGYGIFNAIFNFDTLQDFYQSQGILNPTFLIISFAILEILFLITIGIGILTRVFSIAALITLGVRLQWDYFGARYWALLILLMGILFLGSGKFALWTPEDWIATNRFGEKDSP